ncbi:ParB N-terminal domain-containing protein [Rhodobacter sp. SY28-1]|uniref:ParB N-terminal domain-containing protein n=1 Tax=Rhodobacter sp. SY28-1 TaxID=2562317 RepID=UPI0010C0B97C|nr:ParB N-terminal domain-containing protein [Rhodobacter sp. SY28-1]
MMMDISRIRLDGGTQSRVKINEITVSEYVEAMSDENNVFPPVVVYHDGTDYWLADGFHRLAAWARIGKSKIPADFRKGDQRRAILHSLKANTTHGLRRSNEDKRHSVMMLLEDPEWSQWPQAKIAEACVVSREFVNRVSKEMSASCDRSQDAIRTVDRSGKTYQQNTTKIGKARSEVSADALPEQQDILEEASAPRADQGSDPFGSAVEDARNALAQMTRDMLIDTVIGLRVDLAEARATIEGLRSKNVNLATQLEAALAGDAVTVLAGLHAQLEPADVPKSHEPEEHESFGNQDCVPNEQVEDIWNTEAPF